MSMEMRVFFEGPLPPPTTVTKTMQQLGLNFLITDPVGGFDRNGFMPMSYGDGEVKRKTGTEVYLSSAKTTITELGIDPMLDQEIAFRWGSDFIEGACAAALSAAIAKLTNGVIWDGSVAEIISLESTINACHDMVRAGTNP